MSEAEDPHSASELRDEDYHYRLKRIGPPPSCPKVLDVMRLNLGLTRIGRGQHNDYYLDSAHLKNFISRSHVEIVGTKNENGEIEFVLNDKGLNGTFINDIRTHKTCVLEVGDKITFGHTNGYKIQPGAHAEQPNSEFQFVFEKIPKSAKTSELYPEDLSSDNFNREESSDAIVDQKKDAIIDRSFLSDIQSNLQTQEKTAKSKHTPKERSRQDSSSQSDTEVIEKKSSSLSKGSKKMGKTNSETTQPKEISAPRRKLLRGNTSVLSETIPAVVEPEVEPEEEPEEEEPEEEEEEEEEELEKKKVPKKKKPVPVKKLPPRGRKMPERKEESSESESSSDDDDSRPEADQRPRSQTRQKQIQKKRRAPGTSSNNAPAVGSRKKRRKASTATSNDNLEPGVEWYEDETCESADCKRPKKKRTSWVQCDDCDGWYHTVCVGANYDLLKDSDAHFNCGCVQD